MPSSRSEVVNVSSGTKADDVRLDISIISSAFTIQVYLGASIAISGYPIRLTTKNFRYCSSESRVEQKGPVRGINFSITAKLPPVIF